MSEPIVKITNKEVEEVTGYSCDQVTYMRNNYPKALELIKKGILFERIEQMKLINIDKIVVVDKIIDGSLKEEYFRKPRIKKQ